MAPHRQHGPRDLLVDAIEQELRRLLLLDGPLPTPLTVAVDAADTLDDAAWLSTVLLPRLRLVQRSRQWSACNDTTRAALQRLDGQPEHAPLRELLAQLDAHINTQ